MSLQKFYVISTSRDFVSSTHFVPPLATHSRSGQRFFCYFYVPPPKNASQNKRFFTDFTETLPQIGSRCLPLFPWKNSAVRARWIYGMQPTILLFFARFVLQKGFNLHHTLWVGMYDPVLCSTRRRRTGPAGPAAQADPYPTPNPPRRSPG